MVQAFGDVSLLSLGMMFPDDTVPLDDIGFEGYLNTKFLKSSHLFSDIKTAVSKIRINHGAPLTVESLQTYHSSFCKSLVPFSDEIVLLNTSPDLHVTLIKAFYEGIPKSFASKLQETSCSTWNAAQTNFRDCLTKANVQLAIAIARPDFRPYEKKSDQPEGKKALSATNTSKFVILSSLRCLVPVRFFGILVTISSHYNTYPPVDDFTAR